MYRYTLTRELTGPLLSSDYGICWVMLNPSTADEKNDDPTIRRCMHFAKREGASRMVVVNLFAYRATSPLDLALARYPHGPENLKHVTEQASRWQVVCAWGSNTMVSNADPKVMDFLKTRPCWCLGVTKDGSPRHPLYVKSDQPLVQYNWKTQTGE